MQNITRKETGQSFFISSPNNQVNARLKTIRVIITLRQKKKMVFLMLFMFQMLMLTLSDGSTEIQGMEYTPIPALKTSLPPGIKVSNFLIHSI